jgi:hypothetical protein
MDTLCQSSKIIKELKRAGNKGLANHDLARISLKYSSRITELRHDGYDIMAIRQYLPNGRATGTWRYYLNREEEQL